MQDFTITLQHPWLLFLLIPALLCTLIPFFRIPKKFRRTRNRVISVTLHTLAVVLCVTLIAGMSFAYTVPNRENELLILVDITDSNQEQEDVKDEYVQTITNLCGNDYKMGIIPFGYRPAQAAPFTYNAREAYRQYLSIKNSATEREKLDTTATDIAAALEYAAQQFTNPRTAKIVLLSDGLETDSDAMTAAELIAARGIKIDTVSFPGEAHGEVQITGVTLPAERVVPDVEVDLHLTVESSVDAPTLVTVTLYDNTTPDTAISATLQKGEQTITVPHTFQTDGAHDLWFELKSDNDHWANNNVCQTYLDISAFDGILILESIENESADIADALMTNGYFPKVMHIYSDRESIPKTSRELCAYQQVILVNISNQDLKSVDEHFDAALYEYVHELGGSMLTVGGEHDNIGGVTTPHAYNREDMKGSLLQQMLPVEVFEDSPPVAVMLVVDSSGSMSSGRFRAALDGAESIVENSLSEQDYCGVMTFTTSASEEASVLPMSRKEDILTAIDRLRATGSGEGSGTGGTVFSGAIERAGIALAATDADRKHIILITDGDPSDHLEATGDNDDNAYGKYIDRNVERGVSMSVVTLGLSENDPRYTMMEETAERGQGKHYNVASGNYNEVSSLLGQDLEAVPLAEFMDGIKYSPTVGDRTSIFRDIDVSATFPTLTGYYGVRAKDDESVVVPLEYGYLPVYAAWKFGAGNVGSFLGTGIDTFLAEPLGSTLFGNISESLAPMQPPDPDTLDFVIEQKEDNYSTRLNVFSDCAEGEQVRVTVRAISADAQSMYPNGVEVTSVGNNVGFDFTVLIRGVYEIVIEKVDAQGVVLSDVVLTKTFSYSEEYDAIHEDGEGERFLASLAQRGGGTAIADPVEIFASFEEFVRKTFDPALTFLIVIMVCVLLDIAVRKFKFKWLHEILRDRKERKETAAQGGGHERS